jgi:hypothetical protein
VWRTRFGRGYGPVVRQTTELMSITGILNWLLIWLSSVPSRKCRDINNEICQRLFLSHLFYFPIHGSFSNRYYAYKNAVEVSVWWPKQKKKNLVTIMLFVDLWLFLKLLLSVSTAHVEGDG